MDGTRSAFRSDEVTRALPTGLHGKTPEQVFTTFRERLNDLLHHTITQAPLVQLVSGERAFLEFRQAGDSVAVPVGRGYYLFLAQTLEAIKMKR